MALRDTFASNLKRIRAKRGLSQEALADRAGIDRTYVGALEKGNYSASLDVIEKLALALDVRAELFLRKAKGRRD